MSVNTDSRFWLCPRVSPSSGADASRPGTGRIETSSSKRVAECGSQKPVRIEHTLCFRGFRGESVRA